MAARIKPSARERKLNALSTGRDIAIVKQRWCLCTPVTAMWRFSRPNPHAGTDAVLSGLQWKEAAGHRYPRLRLNGAAGSGGLHGKQGDAVLLQSRGLHGVGQGGASRVVQVEVLQGYRSGPQKGWA